MSRRVEPSRTYADRADVEEFAHGLGMNQLLCREIGHSWRPWSAEWNEAERAYERALRCTRCKTERWETLSGTGEKLGSRYVYPEGYQAPAGMGRIVGDGRDALRIESLRRAIPSAAKRSPGAA